jgi:dipeptidyl-peptidase-4
MIQWLDGGARLLYHSLSIPLVSAEVLMHRRHWILVIGCLLLLGMGRDALAQPRLPLVLEPQLPGDKQPPKKRITLDNVQKIGGMGGGMGGAGFGGRISWADDEHYVQSKGGKQLKVDAESGASEPYKGAAARQTQLSGEMVTLSPDSKHAAFVRNANLFVHNLDTKAEHQVTRDGNGTILNGKADWVYFEELFHRSHKAFWWSPDSAHVAFLRSDDGKVTRHSLLNPTDRLQSPEITAYPKVGGANPVVKVGIAPVTGDAPRWVDLADYGPIAPSLLIVRVGWYPDGKQVYLYLQDRAQTWLDVCVVGVEGGKPTKLFRETTRAWVEDLAPLTFLKDGSFLFLSERTGFKHLYHYFPDGKLKQPVTQGPWDVRKVVHVNEADGWVGFSGTRDGWLGSNFYRVKLDGNDLVRLTKEAGTHTVSVSPGGKYFIDTWSSYDTAPQVSLCRTDGSQIRVIEAAVPNKLRDQYELGKDELVQIPMADGFMLPARIVFPPGLDSARKYPVWFMTYGGPGMPTLHDSWSGGGARDQALASAGYIVFRFDPRSASNMGAISAWSAYRQLGVQETRDIESAITWLCKTYSAVDAKRIGMSGTSYGGYITAYAMTHTKLFAAGIAGAPVTDWHNYDSIYTERYMGLPDDNPKGYEAGSVVKAAKNLHGRLLIVHGMMDDNVHVQNAMELIAALQRADCDFELMVYPHARHGGFGKHYQRLQNDFMKRVLQP